MSVVNKGVGGTSWNLIQNEPDQPIGAALPPDSLTSIRQPRLNGSVDDSPKSAVSLLDAPLIYNNADRVASVSWANSGSLAGNDLVYVDEPIQEDHISFPGTVGNYMSVPDSAALDLAGNTEIEIVARVAADWYSERRQVIVAKKGAGAASWELSIKGDATGAANGRLILRVNSTDSEALAQCLTPIPAIPDETLWIKATWDGSKLRYYIAPDAASEPTNWMIIGSDTSNQSATGSIAANTENVYIGGDPNAGASSMLDGRLYYLAVRDAIGGTEVLEIDVPVDCAAMTPDVTTTFTATSGQTVTLAVSGTPPATCRYHNTLDVTLAHPWYETTIPASLVPDHMDLLHVWVNFDVGTSSTPHTVLPLVSVMGATPHATPNTYHPGWGIWYSTSAKTVGSFLQSNSLGIAGTTTYSSWSAALGTGERVTNSWLDRNYVSNTTRFAGMMTYTYSADTLTGYSGNAAHWAVLGSRVFTQNKLRIIAYTSNPVDINEVGIQIINDKKPPSAGQSATTVWQQSAYDATRAQKALEPKWNLGEGYYFDTSGSPLWLGGLSVDAGDWVVSTSANGTNESVVTWQKYAGSYVGWLTGSIYPMSFGDDLVISSTEDLFVWVVVSSYPELPTFNDYLEGYDPVFGGYIDMGVMLKSDPDDEFFFEIDGALDYQYGDVVGSGYTGVSYDEPVIVAMYLERGTVVDRLWGYASWWGTDWVEGLEVTPALLGEVRIDSPYLTIGENANSAVWGVGLDYGADLTRPTVGRLTGILNTIKSRNQRVLG